MDIAAVVILAIIILGVVWRHIRRQVFAHSFAIEQYSPRLNLPREKNRQALEQARKKDDVYRFPLPTPVTVNAGCTTSGRPFIRGWG